MWPSGVKGNLHFHVGSRLRTEASLSSWYGKTSDRGAEQGQRQRHENGGAAGADGVVSLSIK